MDAAVGGLAYWWVDVFATRESVSGNRLMVFVPATSVIEDEAVCQRIAAEIGFSEVSFLVPDAAPEGEGPTSYRARIFTPSGELAYAGHPTLGSAVVWALETAPMVERVRLRQRTHGATLRVHVERRPGELGHMAWTAVPEPRFEARANAAEVGHAFGVRAADLEPDGLPIGVAEGPNRQLLVPMPASVLEGLRPVPEALASLCRTLSVGTVYAFSPPGADGRLKARGFANGHVVEEDPATGSAAGYVGSYLAERGRFAPGTRLVVEQGRHVRRPSELYLQRTEDGSEILLGGAVRTVARGRLLPDFLA